MTRSLAAAVSGLLAAVLLPLSIVSVWVDREVSDTDRYVKTVTPLADDDVVKAAATKELERQTLRLMASNGADLPGAEQVVHVVVQQAVEGPAFRTAWIEANRSAHQQLVAVLEGRSNASVDDQGQVTIDLARVLEAITESLGAQGVVDIDQASGGRATLVVMDADQLAKARRSYDAIQALGFWTPILWAAFALLTVLLSRRRLAAVAKLALASLLGLGLLALLLVFARDAATADLPQREVALAVWDVVLASLWRTLAVVAVVVAVVAVAAGLLSRLRPPAETPSEAWG